MKKILTPSHMSPEIVDLSAIIGTEKPFSIIQVFDVDEFE